MPSLRRADLDALAYRLRAEGLTYQAIAERLGVTQAMAVGTSGWPATDPIMQLMTQLVAERL